MRYRLRTLLIGLALGPPVLSHVGGPIVYWMTHNSLITETLTNYDRRVSYGSGWNLPYETGDGSQSNSVE